ncbi:7070_t:CDS:1, partial [Gigaspora rosea]
PDSDDDEILIEDESHSKFEGIDSEEIDCEETEEEIYEENEESEGNEDVVNEMNKCKK